MSTTPSSIGAYARLADYFPESSLLFTDEASEFFWSVR
jgi:hypothetical protein